MVNHNKVERVEFRSKPIKVTRPPEPRHQIQAVSKLQVAARDAYKEAQRKKTGFFGSDIGSVPKDEWDRMTWEHRDAVVRAREAATSAALSVLGGIRVPPRVIEVPALVMPRSIWEVYKHQDPSTVKGFLNQALAARYRHAGVPVPRSTAPYVFHNPGKLADRLTRAFENLPDDPGAFADRLASRGVYHIGVRETGARQGLLHGSTGEEVGAQMRNLWQEHRVLPVDSVYLKFKGDKYIRGSNHHSDIVGVHVTPDKRVVIRDDSHVKGAAGDLIAPGAPTKVPHTLLVTEEAENTVVLPVLRGSQSTQAGGLPMGGGRMYPGGILGVQQDNRGGDSSKQATPRRSDLANFLATDKVPETLFGIPVVASPEQYTESDIAFFEEHPKAGGFYELGDEDTEDQAAEGAGDTLVEKATLSDEGRPMHIFRNSDGKITGYGTTRSIIHEHDGKFYVIPTIVPDHKGGSKVIDDAAAIKRFVKTKEHWGGYRDRWSAEDAAEVTHDRHAQVYGKTWNDYIQSHWDELSDEIKNDPDVKSGRHVRTRGEYPGSLNNPGNIEKRKERRVGEVDSPHERWAKFATPQDGLREMADVIRQIAVVKLLEKKGLNFTLRNYAEVYAPRYNKKGEIENDTDKYIADISKDSGFDADEELPRWDENSMARLLRSAVKFESGALHSAWFTEKEYLEAARKLQEGAFE